VEAEKDNSSGVSFLIPRWFCQGSEGITCPRANKHGELGFGLGPSKRSQGFSAQTARGTVNEIIIRNVSNKIGDNEPYSIAGNRT
jgi:hypothetical protein